MSQWGTRMKLYKNILIIAVMWLLSTSNAVAYLVPDYLPIDFRDTIWQPANNQTSYTLDGVKVTAYGYDCDTYHLNYQITGDGVNHGGLGIGNTCGTGDMDEINKGEMLEVKFDGGRLLTGVWITGLYDWEPGLNENFEADEYGHLIVNGTTTIDFGAYNNGQYPTNTPTIGTNGERWVDFGGPIMVNDVEFHPGTFGEDADIWNEYSVAGFTAPVPVLEPATMLLFGTGLAGIGLMRRYKK